MVIFGEKTQIIYENLCEKIGCSDVRAKNLCKTIYQYFLFSGKYLEIWMEALSSHKYRVLSGGGGGRDVVGVFKYFPGRPI
jgi:hypothetical protein